MKFTWPWGYFWIGWWMVLLTWFWLGWLYFPFDVYAKVGAWIFYVWLPAESIGASLMTKRKTWDVVMTASQVPQFISKQERPGPGRWWFTYTKALALLMTLSMVDMGVVVFSAHGVWMGAIAVFVLFFPLFRHFHSQSETEGV